MFINHGYDATVISDTDQQLTLKLLELSTYVLSYTYIMYAKYDRNLRLKLWDDLYSIAQGLILPWLIDGDFNTILNEEENIGGFTIVDNDTDDFRSFIESYDLGQLPFKKSPFTW